MPNSNKLKELPRLRFEMYVDDDLAGVQFLIGKVWFIESVSKENEKHIQLDTSELSIRLPMGADEIAPDERMNILHEFFNKLNELLCKERDALALDIPNSSLDGIKRYIERELERDKPDIITAMRSSRQLPIRQPINNKSHYL